MDSPAVKAFESWMTSATAQTGFTKERIKELLEPEFGKWTVSQAPEMMMYLMSVRDQEQIEAIFKKEVEQKKMTACPICGAETFADRNWDGKYTKTKGWVCAAGGLTHWMMWRTNNIMKIEGKPPLYPEVVSDNNQASVQQV